MRSSSRITRWPSRTKRPRRSQRDVEARFRLGEAQLALGQREEARRTWQDLLAAHADAKHDHIPQAAFNLSATYGLPSPANKEELSLGVSSLESFLKKYPDHKLAPQAHLRIAQSQLNFGRNADAVKAIERFLADKRYAEKDEIADARNLLGRAYQLQKKFDEALAAWRDYLPKHPSHSAWSDVQRAIIDTEYLIGAEQRQNKQFDEARKSWSEFMVKYPLDGRNPAILYQLGQMNFEQEKYDEAIADWRRLVTKYPGTNESSQAQYMIAATLEGKLGKLEEALEEYKKVTWGTFNPHARSGRRPADGQDHVDRHRPRVPQQRDAADQAHLAEHRHGDGEGVQGRSGDLLPQDAQHPRRRGARHLADRPGPDDRVQGARIRRISAA